MPNINDRPYVSINWGEATNFIDEYYADNIQTRRRDNMPMPRFSIGTRVFIPHIERTKLKSAIGHLTLEDFSIFDNSLGQISHKNYCGDGWHIVDFDSKFLNKVSRSEGHFCIHESLLQKLSDINFIELGITCTDCGQVIESRTEIKYQNNNHNILCSECYAIKYCECERCGNVTNSNNLFLMENYEYHGSRRRVCQSCYDDMMPICSICGERHAGYETMRGNNGVNICNSCQNDRHYLVCNDCCGVFPESEMGTTEGNTLCIRCHERYERNNTIKSYNYKPRPVFHRMADEPELFIGAEIEMDEGGESSDKAYEAVKLFNKFAYCKHDGSLEDGIEIVTHPATYEYLDYVKPIFKRFFNWAKNAGYEADEVDTCGLHFHVGKNFLGNTATRQDYVTLKILYVFEKFWNEFVIFSRRTEKSLNKWAGRYQFDTKDMRQYLKNAKQGGKYFAVNLANRNTIEFRMFKGTLDINTFYATMQLIHTIVTKCKKSSITKLQNMTFKQLTKSKFVELNDYMKNLQLI